MNCTRLSIGIVLAAALATGVAARQGTPQQAPPPKPAQTKSTPATAMKVTGCLKRDTTANPSSTTPPAGQSKPTATYKLTHAEGDALKGGTEISLRPAGKVNLGEHVDHKVELTGKVVADKPSTKGSASTGASASSKPTTTMTEHVPVFQVSSVKMVASTCQ